jgi:hypothetical protein
MTFTLLNELAPVMRFVITAMTLDQTSHDDKEGILVSMHVRTRECQRYSSRRCRAFLSHHSPGYLRIPSAVVTAEIPNM